MTGTAARAESGEGIDDAAAADSPHDALPGLFDGVKVLEIGQFVAAPIAAELFAHGGADVIRLEPVNGDVTRATDPLMHADGSGPTDGRQYVVKARGKRALPLDLSSDAGRNIAVALALRSDVVITNLRPGTAARLGLDFDSLRGVRPQLVYGEINGFGDVGPHADRPSLDLIAQAWSGLRFATGTVDGELGSYEPYFCDYIAGLLLAFGVSAALRHRDITGVGQRVSTSLAQAGLYAQHRSANLFESTDAWKRELVSQRVAGASFASLAAMRSERVAPDVFFMTTYATCDGAVAVGAPGVMGRQLCEIFGTVDPRTEPSWADRSTRTIRLAETKLHIARRLAVETTEWVVERLQAAGIPVAPVRLLEEVLIDPDVHEAGLVYQADHPRLGRYIMPTAPVHMSGAHYRARNTFARHGEHTDEVLGELGFDAASIEQLVTDGVVART